MNWKEYFAELQRRHVVKAGIAYLVVSWLIIQVISVLLPMLGLSLDISRPVLIVLAIGFPIWLIIAWVYDFSADGIKKTDDVAYDPEEYKRKNISLNRFIIGGLLIAVILLVVNTLRLSDKVDTLEVDYLATNFKSSIAVLALEDRSPNKDQEHLSFGISENIYDRLIKFKDLKVTSPTSSFYYKDKDVSFDVIAKDLDVAYILEGSIIPVGDNYRISLRLIDTKDNAAIWTKTYDDKKENILMTYDDLAQNIVRYLKLTVDEKEVQNKKVDPEAYDLYLRAHLVNDKGGDGEVVERAVDSLLRQALKIDSTYAPIHAWYAGTLFRQTVYYDMMDRDEGLRRAMQSAKKAYNIDPENVLALTWCSNISWHLRDMEGNQKYIDEMLALELVNANVLHYLQWQFRRINQVDKGYHYAKKAVQLDPRNVDIMISMIQLETYYGNFDEVLRLTEKIGEIFPDSDSYFDDLIFYYLNTKKFSVAMDLIKEKWEYEDPRVWEILIEGRQGNLDYFEANLDYLKSNHDDVAGFNYNTACIYAINGLNDKAFEHLDGAFEDYVDEPEFLFIDADLKSLHDDSRWEGILDRLGEYFNYDFKHQPE